MPAKTYSAYRLFFTGPVHISDSRDDYGTSLRSVSSDTMYAALTATLAKMGRDIPTQGDLGCVISALFPFYQKGSTDAPTYFFPKPISLHPPRLKKENTTDAKKMKKVKWIDKVLFQRVLDGNGIFDSNTVNTCIKGEYMTASEFDESFVVSEVLERVAISRSFEDARPYYIERIHFKGKSGLFFLVDGNTDLIDDALPLLAAEGLGTDKSTGYGLFEFERFQLRIELPDKAEYGMILSSFIPEDKNQLKHLLEGDSSAYELSRLGGWISSAPYISLRKNAIYAFCPGSVFYDLPTGVGRIVDLAPKGLVQHPIWRCGKALVVPIKL